jgi:AraC-like DNA-binding protein
MRQPSSLPDSPSRVRVTRIRTEDWPERDRVAIFHEMHGRDRIRVEPRGGEPLRIDARVVRFANFALLRGRRSPLRSEFSDGNDRLVFNLAGPAIAAQFGREVRLERGDAIALCGSDRGTLMTTQSGPISTLEFPRGALMPLLNDPRHACARRIPNDSTSLQLLRAYVEAAHRACSTENADVPAIAIAHMYDLAALTIGAARETESVARGRGLRAARLRAIKNDILARIDRDIELTELAGRHGLSGRYVRMLFESDGTSVTEFIRDERLKRARSMLLNPRFATRKIAEVAYESGFNDLSYFNRAFRRRFGQSPSEIRDSS